MRNENGFGSITCLDKTGKKRRKPWAVRITTGWEDGKQVRKYLGFYRTKKEALVALGEYHKGGLNLDMSGLSLNEVFDLWFEQPQLKELSEGAKRAYMMVRKRFGKLGELPMKDIKAKHLQDWMGKMDVKPSTKSKMKSVLNQVYNFAIANDIVQKNYTTILKPGKSNGKVGEIFSDEEIKLLWEHKDNEFARQILIMIYTGMRIGELLKVKREDIYFDENYIIGGSKTEAGIDRIIPLHRIIIPLIKEQLGDNKWLIQSNKGDNHFSYDYASNKYKELFASLHINHKPHDCRKTAVSLMHSAGIPMEVIRIIVGHAGQGVTEQVYLRKNAPQLVEYINKVVIEND